jgi:hypothetical protein
MYGPTLHIAKDVRYPEACIKNERIDSWKCVCILDTDIENFDSGMGLDYRLVVMYEAATAMGIHVCWCDRS